MNDDLKGILFRSGDDFVIDHRGRTLPESEAVAKRQPSQQKTMTMSGPVDADAGTEYHLRHFRDFS